MKLLSPHELAILICLLNAPGQVAATEPDVQALLRTSLVELTTGEVGEPLMAVTSEGRATLRRLGMARDRQRDRNKAEDV